MPPGSSTTSAIGLSSETRSSALLAAEALTCRRGGRKIFSDLFLQLGAGEAVWLRGPNGAGKTSLLRLLAGLAQPDEGQVLRSDAAAHPGFIGHANALKGELSVAESLSFLGSLRGPLPSREAMREALGRFGLSQRLDMLVRRLSQGQRRKVALARLWLERPSVWLLDEPYDALDRDGCDALDDALAQHLQRGGALVMTSHQRVTLAGMREFMLAPEARA